MTVGIVLRTIALLAGMYTVGLLVTVMSLASLEAAGLAIDTPYCAPGECRATAMHPLPATDSQSGDLGILAAAAFIAGKL